MAADPTNHPHPRPRDGRRAPPRRPEGSQARGRLGKRGEAGESARALARAWHLITGEYPPQPGGVSDYAGQLARALAATGAEVHVWAPATALGTGAEAGVTVHRLEGGFGPRGLRALGAGLDALPPGRLLVQYVPHAFGYRGMNLAFPLWLQGRRREPVWVMFHEVAMLWTRERLALNLLAGATRVMAALMVRRADRLFVSIPAWSTMLPRALRPRAPEPLWLPIPSNVPPPPRPAERKPPDAARVVLGHFGTYGDLIAAQLLGLAPPLLEGHPERRLKLLGRGGGAFAQRLLAAHPGLAGQVTAPGELPAETLQAELLSCDVLLQPYPDGISSRRTSAMAGLALGLPLVTNQGAPLRALLARTPPGGAGPVARPRRAGGGRRSAAGGARRVGRPRRAGARRLRPGLLHAPHPGGAGGARPGRGARASRAGEGAPGRRAE